MQVLSTNKDLPDFVKIDSKEATIKIELAKIKNEMDFYVKANTIDLYNDKSSLISTEKNKNKRRKAKRGFRLLILLLFKKFRIL